MKRGQIGGVIRSSILGALLLGGALGEAQSLRGGIGLARQWNWIRSHLYLMLLPRRSSLPVLASIAIQLRLPSSLRAHPLILTPTLSPSFYIYAPPTSLISRPPLLLPAPELVHHVCLELLPHLRTTRPCLLH